MPDLRAFTLLLEPGSLGCSAESVPAAERAVRRATAAIEARLNRRLVVRRHALTVRSATDWARQWPVVLACEPAPAGDPAGPVELVDAEYPITYGASDDTGERLCLAELPGDGTNAGSNSNRGRLVVYAGYRRADQTRAQLNRALAALEPAWGAAPLSAAAYDRLPLLPADIAEAAEALARGYLALDAAGLGALNSRREERADKAASAVRAANWDEDILSTIDRYAWVEL